MKKCRIAQALCLCLTLLNAFQTPVLAQGTRGFAGIEFFDSSQLSKDEVEKLINLKPGASEKTAQRAIEKLKNFLAEKRIKANIETVSSGQEDFFVSVDLIEGSLRTRNLIFPRHVQLLNEKPFLLLDELKQRQEKLTLEDRPTTERYENGIKFYSDEPCNRIATDELNQLKGQGNLVLKIIASDPNGQRRLNAIELLNWMPNYAENCSQLIPAIADSDKNVRAAATKYIWARLSILPDSFPFQNLQEALSQQLNRPSHTDRARALATLIALAKRSPESIYSIRVFNEERLKEIRAKSLIPNIQNMAGTLLEICMNPQVRQRAIQLQRNQVETGF